MYTVSQSDITPTEPTRHKLQSMTEYLETLNARIATHLIIGAGRDLLKVLDERGVDRLHLLPVDGRPGARLQEPREELHKVLCMEQVM